MSLLELETFGRIWLPKVCVDLYIVRYENQFVEIIIGRLFSLTDVVCSDWLTLR